MVLELNREYPEADEEEIFRKMVDQTVKHMSAAGDGHRLRAQHAKVTACVTARFEIKPDIPTDLRHGVFSEPGRSFDALVRFSNSQGTIEPDGNAAGRGLAIKLLNVTGSRAIEGDGDETQDFLLVNHPVFPFPNPKAYFETIRLKNTPILGDAFAAIHLLVSERKQLAIIKEIKAKRVASPLEINYWSNSPYWLGDAARKSGQTVKYSAVALENPKTREPDDPKELPPDYLTQAASKHLREREAVFDFKLQIQTDAVAMPIEDPSVEWNETASPPVSVATLRIGKQQVDLDGNLAKQFEALSFNPWHALAEHRPLGGMNRLRKAVYRASVEHRIAR